MRLTFPAVLLSFAAVLTACDTPAPVPPDLGVIANDPWSDPAYPPRLGQVTANIAGATDTWTTYDFSVGAFDASAWFSRSYEPEAAEGETTLTLVGYPDGNPRARDGLLRVVLRLDGRPAPGVRVTGAVIELIDDRDFGAPRLAGTGTGALTDVTIGEGSGYGDAAGIFDGSVCPPAGPDSACLTVTGSFVTEVQYDGF